jgi:GNAT superfamily N-acetyltransferase
MFACENGDFEIWPARSVADIEAVRCLFAAYADSLGVDLGYQAFTSEFAGLPGRYSRPAGELLLARGTDGEPIGCVGMRPLAPGCCEMKRLYVAPEARGLGLGSALIDTIIEAAVRIGHREMRLDTLPFMTHAMALYGKAGFAPIAPYYETPVTGTVFLARRLGA